MKKLTIVVTILLIFISILFVTSNGNKDFSSVKIGNENKMVSILVDGEEKSAFPDKSESRYQGTTCSNNESAIFDEEGWKLTIPDITSSTRCTITFISEGHIVKVNVEGGHADEGSKSVDHNGNVTFTLTPQDNYHLYSGITCEGKGTTLFANNVLMVREVKSDVTCNVTYTTLSHEVQLVVNNGSASKSTMPVARGGSDEATLTPNEHFTVREANVVCDPGITGTLNDQTNKVSVRNVYTSGVCTVNLACDDGLYTGEHQNFSYTGGEQTFYACKDKIYKLEVWGAQGGESGDLNNYYSSGLKGTPGKGGYSSGIYITNSSKYVYINVGGQGKKPTSNLATFVEGGYNGGGDGGFNNGGSSHGNGGGSGGGATHIAIVTGLLKDLSSYKDTASTNSSNEILVVAGGGGGSGYSTTKSGDTFGNAGNGGGIVGTSGSKGYVSPSVSAGGGTGGTQETRGSGGNSSSACSSNRISATFGLGGRNGNYPSSDTMTRSHGSGGGGGWYGGGSGGCQMQETESGGGAGGGSGYINSPNLITASNGIKKHMSCYNCETSSDNGTYTVTSEQVSETPKSDYAKSGNGYARITKLASDYIEEYELKLAIDNGGTISKSSETLKTSESTSATFEPATNYLIANPAIDCGNGATPIVTNSTVVVSNVIANITCTVKTQRPKYTVTLNVTNGTSDKATIQIDRGGSGTATITANEGYVANGSIVNCDNGAIGSVSGTTLTISGVYAANTCSVIADCDDGLAVGDSRLYSYTGAAQNFRVCKDHNYRVEVWGASSNDNTYSSSGRIGGKGGYNSGVITFTQNDNLYVYVGGVGGMNLQSKNFNSATTRSARGSGGGATDIRKINGDWDNDASLRSRVIVSGGGGGAYNDASAPIGANAGGLKSQAINSNANATYSSTQTSGGRDPGENDGTIGTFGKGGTTNYSSYQSGAGGWYGGDGKAGSGGGSSYISGHTGCVGVTSTSDSTPKSGCDTSTTDNSCSISPYGYTFTESVMIDGTGYQWYDKIGTQTRMPNPTSETKYALGVGHTGDGYARVTRLANNYTPTFKVKTGITAGTIADSSFDMQAGDNRATTYSIANYYLMDNSKPVCSADATGILTGTTMQISNVRDNAECMVNVYRPKYNVTLVVNNGTSSANTIEVERGGSGTATITANSGLDADGAFVTCDNAVTGSVTGTTLTVNNVYAASTCTITVCDDGLTDGQSIDFDYTGSEQTFSACKGNKYKLEVWGAQGGACYQNNQKCHGGYGGYASGMLTPTSNSYVYINVGGAGEKGLDGANILDGGYNGGGTAGGSQRSGCNGGSGGGATHIATVTGLLSSLSSYKDTGGTNISNEVLLVAGGGGGGADWCSIGSGAADRYWSGGQGGGMTGALHDDYVKNYAYKKGSNGTQTAGGSRATAEYTNATSGSFGQGGRGGYDSINNYASGAGGGGGWYGGGGGAHGNTNSSGPGGGGSGYINSPNLTSNNGIKKHMSCYNCTISDSNSTYSIKTTDISSTAQSDYAKIGNGYARITKLASDYVETYTVKIEVNGGTSSKATVSLKTSESTTATITASTGYKLSGTTVNCGNGATATLSGSTLTISNAVANTTCTVNVTCDDGLDVDDSVLLSYTGAAQNFRVCKDHNYKVELWGAQGGVYGNITSAKFGAYTSGVFTGFSNSNLYVYVGQKNDTQNEGSFNGSTYSSGGGTAGGGATDIRTISGTNWYDDNPLRSRIIVAGGSGSAYKNSYKTGSAGGLIGYSSSSNGHTNTGGTQISGGVYDDEVNGNGLFGRGSESGGATGGGGWYGGSGYAWNYGGGSGGSSYISGHKGCVAVTSTESSSPKSGCTTGTTNKNCSLSPYGYTFKNTVMIDGEGYQWYNTKGSQTRMPNPTSETNYELGVGHSGNGYARITRLSNSYTPSFKVKLKIVGGTISKSSASLASGESTTATFTADDGYTTTGATVSCTADATGSISGTTLTINNVTDNAECTVNNVPNTYTVTFDANGGTVATSSKTVTYTGTYGDLPTPTREGYTFKGWNGKNKFNKELYLLMDDYTFHSKTDYYLSQIQLTPNTTYHLSVIRKNNFDGKNNGYLLIDDIASGNGHWSAIAHNTAPNYCYYSNCNYSVGSSGLLYIGRIAITQSNLDTIWANTDVQIEEGSTATPYEPYYITSTTEVVQPKNHTLTAIWKDNQAPTLNLSKITYIEDDFSNWTLNNATVTTEDGKRVLTVGTTGANGSAESPYIDVNGGFYYHTFDGYVTNTSTYYSPKGGTYWTTYYYDDNFTASLDMDNHGADGHASELNLNEWKNNVIWVSSIEKWKNRHQYGSNVKYIKIKYQTSISDYSSRPVKLRNFKIYGEAMPNSFYLINVSSSDNEGVVKTKYAKGNQTASYFASNGTNVVDNQIRVTENGVYTVYVADAVGNATVQTIEITDIA